MHELRPLLRIHARRWPWLAAGAALMLLAALAGFGLLALSGWFITATGLAALVLAAGGTAALDIYAPGAGIRFFAVGRAVSRYGERLITHEAVLRLLADLRVWVFRRLMGLDLARLGQLRTGDTLSRLTADVDRLDQFYLRLLAPVAVALFGLIIATNVLALFAPASALAVALALAAAAIGAAVVTGRMAAGPGERLVGLAGRLREHILLGLRGMAELRVYGREEDALQRVDALSRQHELTNRALARMAGLTQALGTLATFSGVWLAALLAIPLVEQEVLSGPGFALVLLGALALMELVTPLPLAAQALSRTRTAARRVLSLAPPERLQANGPSRPGDGTLRLEAVSYRYPPALTPVLDSVSLVVQPGDCLAITGPSGTGKSTLIGIVTGALAAESGQVLLGGDAVSDLSPEAIGRRAAWLPQRTVIFNASVADNLRMADPQATEQTLWHVLWLAALDETVAALPNGLETWLGAGGRALSGGEARRLCLARTLLQPAAPLLLLDEPTRGLDDATARRILDHLTRVAEHRGVVVVTHDAHLLPDGFSRQTLGAGRLASAF